MITEDTRVWWHGCWNSAGHYLFEPGGNHGVLQSSTPRPTRYGVCPFPWFGSWLDGGYAPVILAGQRFAFESPALRELGERNPPVAFVCMVAAHEDRQTLMHKSDELQQGKFLRHVVNGCTLLAWWDRTHGDSRGACNSVFIAEGVHDSADMLAWLPLRFPLQAKHLADAGVKLVEVFQ